ncbi:hypothetical protein GUJ93_ZPchr0002g23124 [Zizania palustris]|uniref:Uncharacterized protein n=1 Tax=Zizania palustris TaxID=103762 RepID=A0A8J5VUH0_ZIZPA|nr:hypothetical protein GUJ93_ZPchr0002g23124 [Zizania palustris]
MDGLPGPSCCLFGSIHGIFCHRLVSSATTARYSVTLDFLFRRFFSHDTRLSTHLSSMSSLPFLVSVKTADGTPLPVIRHATLSTSHFHVTFVSHVPQLHL